MKWLESLQQKYVSSVAHVYILHGNTKDFQLFGDGITLFERKLFQWLKNVRDGVACYDKASGWSFLDDQSKTIFQSYASSSAPVPPMMQGMQGLMGSGIDALKSPEAAFSQIGKVLNGHEEGRTCAIVIDHVEALLSADGWGRNAQVDILATFLRKWSIDPNIDDSGNILILVCRDNIGVLHPALRDLENKIEQIYVAYPDKEERRQFIESWKINIEDLDLSDKVLDQIASTTAGLSCRMIADCLMRAMVEKRFDMEFIKERKDEVIRATYNDVIEIMEPKHGFEAVGGLKTALDYLQKNVVKPLKEGNTRRCPMGVLFTGPPGTGKSLTAEAIAKDAGVLFVILRFSKIFSKWVGESEKNLDKVLLAIKAMAPAVVFIDEIDQSGHRRGGAGEGDSGVSSRVFQRLLEFMADNSNRGKVLFLAATNRPDLLDPAMKRAGRFDKKIPFLAPSNDDRRAILEAIIKKRDLKPLKKIPSEVISKTAGYVGADLDSVITCAFEIADDNNPGTDKITEDDLVEAVGNVQPSVTKDTIDYMTFLALEECNDKRLIPELQIKRLRETFEVPDPLEVRKLKKGVLH